MKSRAKVNWQTVGRVVITAGLVATFVLVDIVIPPASPISLIATCVLSYVVWAD